MADWNTGSVANQALRYLDNPPNSVSGNMTLFAEEAISSLNNTAKTSLDSTSTFADTYAPALVHMTAANALGAMTGIGADFSYKLGDLSVNKGQGENQHVKQQRYHLDKALREMKRLPKPIRFHKSNG